MEQLWQQLIQALALLSPDLVQSLRPGVNEQALQEAEQRLGILFPEELRAYFRLHNGSRGPLFGSWSLLSLEDMCHSWHILKQKAEEDQHYYQESLMVPHLSFSSPPSITQPPLWQKTWLPLLQSGRFYAEYTWLVLDATLPYPEDSSLTESNEESQRLFYYRPLEDDLTYPSSATSIAQVLYRLLQALQTGVYLYEPQTQKLVTLTYTSPLARIHEPNLYEVFQHHPETLPLFKERLAYPGVCCTSYSALSTEQSHALHEQTMEQSWTRLRTALRTLAPIIEADLQPGARSEDLEQCEAMLDQTLPKDVRTLYSLCNGASTDEQGSFTKGLFDMWSWYDLEAIIWRRQLQREHYGEMEPLRDFPASDARIQALNFHSAWIPFLVHEDGNLLCIDMAPTPLGQQGQIILLRSGVGYAYACTVLPLPPRVWVAPSLHAFVANLAQDMLLGKYTFSASERMLWSKEGFSYMTEDENMRYSLSDRRRRLLHPDQHEPPFDLGSLFLEMEPPSD